MPSTSALLTIRRGHELIAIHDLDLAREILKNQRHDSPPDNVANGHALLSQVQKAANSVHDVILKAYPHLSGPATSSFSTALRVSEVRTIFTGHRLRGIPLDKLLTYLASAADAGHLRRKEGFDDAHRTQHATQDTTQGATKLNPAPYPTHSMFTPVGRLAS